MNSGCACVASHAVGSAPYLIKDGENGVLFENENIRDLYNKVEYLLKNRQEVKRLGVNAYRTINDEWNAVVAAERLVILCENLMRNENSVFENGICSKAEVLKNRWYKNEK